METIAVAIKVIETTIDLVVKGTLLAIRTTNNSSIKEEMQWDIKIGSSNMANSYLSILHEGAQMQESLENHSNLSNSNNPEEELLSREATITIADSTKEGVEARHMALVVVDSTRTKTPSLLIQQEQEELPMIRLQTVAPQE